MEAGLESPKSQLYVCEPPPVLRLVNVVVSPSQTVEAVNSAVGESSTVTDCEVTSSQPPSLVTVSVTV